MYFHFLGKAAWKVKNVRGAIEIAGMAEERIHIIGGSRLSFRMGLNMLSPHARFHGMVGGYGKNALIQASKGLIFPALWHEPFGLAIPESLYFGCPVFGTPYGSLPELLGAKAARASSGNGYVEAVHSDFGFLSVKKQEIADALRETDQYDRNKCQEYARDCFSAQRMARDYVRLYEEVAGGHLLHPEAPVLEEAPDKKMLLIE
jgi:glycosyltransferase involved in cell wall biosynthesis